MKILLSELKIFMTIYGTAQFKLYAHMWVHACADTFCVYNCSVSSLLHAVLSCALMQLKTRGTLDVHYTSKLITSTRSTSHGAPHE